MFVFNVQILSADKSFSRLIDKSGAFIILNIVIKLRHDGVTWLEHDSVPPPHCSFFPSYPRNEDQLNSVLPSRAFTFTIHHKLHQTF